jgi:hypothetical protein
MPLVSVISTLNEHDAAAKFPEYKVVAVKIRKSKVQHK